MSNLNGVGLNIVFSLILLREDHCRYRKREKGYKNHQGKRAGKCQGTELGLGPILSKNLIVSAISEALRTSKLE